jgi:hypothetical protein
MADGGTVALDWPLLDIDNPVGATLILLVLHTHLLCGFCSSSCRGF